MVLLVLSITLLSAFPLLSAAEDTYVITPMPDTPCPILPQSKSCLTVSEYAREETFLFQHHTGVPPSPCRFTMVGSLFSSLSSLGEPTTTISCIGPAILSFYESQEVKLQAIEFVHCSDIDQPAIMVSSVQYFEMIECRLKDGRSFVVFSSLALQCLEVVCLLTTALWFSKDVRSLKILATFVSCRIYILEQLIRVAL